MAVGSSASGDASGTLPPARKPLSSPHSDLVYYYAYSSAPLQTLPEPLQPPEQGTSAEEVVPGTPEAAAAAKTARTIRDQVVCYQVKTREKTVYFYYTAPPLRSYGCLLASEQDQYPGVNKSPLIGPCKAKGFVIFSN